MKTGQTEIKNDETVMYGIEPIPTSNDGDTIGLSPIEMIRAEIKPQLMPKQPSIALEFSDLSNNWQQNEP